LNDSGSALGSGHDFGDNDPGTVLAMGDSITEGGYSGGAPWPSRLEPLIGKRVINSGRVGERVFQGEKRIRQTLDATRPGFVIIFYGANDAIQNTPISITSRAIRNMVAEAEASQTIPVLATVLPMSGSRSIYNRNVDAINEVIRSVASQTSASVVNTHGAIARNPDLYLADGIHLSDSGELAVTFEFMDHFL
jgi:lysophospholipase L1-like esterase